MLLRHFKALVDYFQRRIFLAIAGLKARIRFDGTQPAIGRGATIGSGCTILYDTKIGEFARIEPLTLVMKGEQIPAHTMWQGAPAVPYIPHVKHTGQVAA